MRVTILGSGTSTGVPVIGCDCAVCTSSDARNRRTRPALWIELPTGHLLVDTPPDLREQALRFRLPRVDAVLFTHAHADHIFGLDDLRIYNFRQRMAIPCWGDREALARVRAAFSYIWEDGPEGGGRPQLELCPIEGPFEAVGARIVPVPLWHGPTPVLGFRLGSFAYLTDVSRIPETSFELLGDLELLILGALRYRPHPTHFSVAEAVAAAGRIGARRTVLTHLAHDIDVRAPAFPLPPEVNFGYDGLAFELA